MSPLLSYAPDELQRFMVTRIPFNDFLGLQMVRIAHGELEADLPFNARFAAAHGGLHEGPITTLLDTLCGTAVLTVLAELRRTATLDLRIDVLRPAAAGRAVRAHAQVLAVSEHLTTVRGVAHDGDVAAPVAVATATFAVFAPGIAPPAGAAP